MIDKDNPENSDSPGNPTGASFKVDWDAVYPLKENASLSDYPAGTEVYAAAQEFESAYRIFLEKLEHAFDGKSCVDFPSRGNVPP